jgi:hypothetical protein
VTSSFSSAEPRFCERFPRRATRDFAAEIAIAKARIGQLDLVAVVAERSLVDETFADIVEHLVPELKKRGVYRREYTSSTSREKLFGAGARLPETHPGAQYRDLSAAARQGRAAAE